MANPRLDYDWGSPSAIPEFLGEESSGKPVAEVWVGAHPKAPSTLLGFHGTDVPLDRAIHERPEELLGGQGLARWGPRLPFLVKLLAAGKPLSLQVHPDADMAAQGFGREEEEGVALDAPERTYKDPHHKPEVMVALDRTYTLAGLRTASATAALLRRVGGVWAADVRRRLDDRDMVPALRALLDSAAWRAHGPEVLARCRARAPQDEAFALVEELHHHFPGDSGVAAPLMLNVVAYDRGQALFVPTGQIHAHVRGFGIEVMAASDNVVRAGLTGKHIDQDSLFRSVMSRPQSPELRVFTSGRLNVGVKEFQIHMMMPGQSTAGFGPQVLMALEDGTAVGPETLRRGETLFLGHGEHPVLVRGRACLVYEPLPDST